MSDLLIPNLDPDVQRSLEQRARAHDRDVVEEAKALLRASLGLTEATQDFRGPPPGIGVGDWLFSLVPAEYRVDLDCELLDVPRDPPDFR